MNLPPMGLPLPLPLALPAAGALPLPRPVPEIVNVDGWMLQLQRAQSAQSLPQEDAARDESCGMPVAPPDPGPPRVASAAPAPPPPEEPLPPRHSGEPEVQRTPLRVHVQHEPSEGLKVWLGIDGHAALVAQRATAAVADLRRGIHGERIAAVVCNGVPVYTRADASPRSSPLKDSP